MTENTNELDKFTLQFKWTVSRAPDTYGWNICTLYVNGAKVARCNGGGYDMEGTVLGLWIAGRFAEQLRAKITTPMYRLTFHDPDFDPGKAVVPGTGETVQAREAAGESLGLERYQAIFRSSSPLPSPTHRIPRLDGACGTECMIKVLRTIGGHYQGIDFGGRSQGRGALVSVPRTLDQAHGEVEEQNMETPATQIELGRLRLSISANTSKKGQEYHTGRLAKVYRGKDGNLHETTRLRLPQDLDALEQIVEATRDVMRNLEQGQDKSAEQTPRLTHTR